MAKRSWVDLTAEERQRFLAVLEGMRQGAVEHETSTKGTAFDTFFIEAVTAAMAELRKAAAS